MRNKTSSIPVPASESEKLPGNELIKPCAPYGSGEYARHYESGENMLRTKQLSQPSALQVGDILATGDRLLSPPREGGNGRILLHLEGGGGEHWVGVPSRIPIALFTEEDSPPKPCIVWKHHHAK